MIFDEATVARIIQHLILHGARQQHVLALPSADFSRLLLHVNDLIVQLAILVFEVSDALLVLLDVMVLVADDLGQVLELLHLLQILVTLLVDGRQVLLICRLHIR